MAFWKKIWKRKNKAVQEDIQPQEQEGAEDYLVDISQVNLEDAYERERYVISLLEQIKDAQEQVHRCEAEYKTVDSYLVDMEEIGYMSQEDRDKLTELARSVSLLQQDKQQFEEKPHRLTDEDFARMERLEDDTDDGVRRLKEAEEYQQLVRADLQKLEAEKQACLYRRQEAATMMENLRGIALIGTVAVFCGLLLLLCMQFVLHMEVIIGDIMVAAAAALMFLTIYMKYTDASKEDIRASRSLNKVILLQNRVKIRYVNNTNLLDYLYLKFGISSAQELEKLREQYLQEKEQRSHMKDAMLDLSFGQEQMVKLLRRYRLHDPLIWLHQVDALLDPKEMVEVRHALIGRRQKLRKQIEFNTQNAENAQNQIKSMVADYPQYAKETLKIVSDYE